ncbi:hypothetical protein [Brachybacterium sp. AOP29-B2-41]|uniref:hypothetical protein n=1 Tax=Brachybacterium sp. AOP29-B2-41 TaxID=3457704 RepID=UPI0040342566
MRSQAPYADLLLRQSGHGGLWEWAMGQRRSVRPPNWAELAVRLTTETEGAVVVKGDMLRKWLLAAEDTRTGSTEFAFREGARP